MHGKIGDLRPSQIISTFGPGAIVDLPDFSIVVAGLDFWDRKICAEIHEPRLEKKLGLRKILAPPTLEHEDTQGTLPAFRFPEYLVCPKCRRIAPDSRFYVDPETQVAYCTCDPHGRVQVFPSRFIVACPDGHLSDFPWHRYVHLKKGNFSCPGRRLRLEDRGVTGSIADVEVVCDDCGAHNTMADAFMESTDALGHCPGRRPWLGRAVPPQRCSRRPRAILRGASNAYFPMVESALHIPPYTSPVHQAVSSVMDRLTKIASINALETAIAMGVLRELEEFSLSETWSAILEQRSLAEGPTADILYPEWRALCQSQVGGGFDFETVPQRVPASFEGLGSRLVMVRRLVEVRVLTGFTRIDPPPDLTSLASEDGEESSTPGTARMNSRVLDWMPGIVTHGEGIFLTLNEDAVARWEFREPVSQASGALKTALAQYYDDRRIQSSQRPEFPGARYVLLHTLAHVLMRQLCLHSGYSSTSLRERIYSRRSQNEAMAGLLIYTATPDSEGSLGGLVEQGSTNRFAEILWAALQGARLCSGDPLCAEHRPGDVGDLNGAACHACTLAPETSCERSNRLLDRSFLVRTVSRADTAFFD